MTMWTSLIAVMAIGAFETPFDGIEAAQCNQSSPMAMTDWIEHWRKQVGISDDHYHLLGGEPKHIAELIAECDADMTTPRCGVLGAEVIELGSVLTSLLDGEASETGRLVALTNTERSWRRVLDAPQDFEVQCTAPAPSRADDAPEDRPDPGPQTSDRDREVEWRLALDPDNLVKPARKLRAFAAFSLSEDVKNDEEAQTIQLAFGRHVSWGERSVMPFMAIHRRVESAADPEDENLFQVGLQADNLIRFSDGRRLGRLQAQAAYLTDDSLEASGVRYQLGFRPALRIPGYEAYRTLFGIDGPLEYAWTFNASVDHLNIDEVGEAFDGTEDEATRLGADVQIFLRTSEPVGDVTPQLSLAYGVREAFDADHRSLSHLRLGLDLLPQKDGVFSFGVSYESGESFDSLKFSQQWMARIGVRY